MAGRFATKGGIATSPMTGLPGYLLGWAGPSGFGASSTAAQVAANWDGAGKVVLITGANTGLGLESARVLAGRGAEVVVACRDAAKGATALEAIKAAAPGAKASLLQLDLTSLESVKKAADEFKASGRPLHVLMLNAGVMACPFDKTKDGHELQFGTNHLGHFALVHHLQPALLDTARAAGAPGRVVSLASSAHFGAYAPEPLREEGEIDSPTGYSAWAAYGQSKLCNVLFARELQRRFEEEELPLVAFACHPGVIPSTDLFRHIALPWVLDAPLRLALNPMMKSMAQGAATQTYLATSDEVLSLGGEYFADVNLCFSSQASHSRRRAARLWEMSERMCGFV